MKLRTKREKELWKSVQKKWTEQSFAALDKPYHKGDLEKYLNTQPKIGLSTDVVEFCDSAEIPIEWSGCGQFYSKSNPENLKFMLSHLHESEELFIRVGKEKNQRSYIGSRDKDRIVISDR